MSEYDYRKIHGSNVVKLVLELFDTGTLVAGDKIYLPCNYLIRFNNQSRAEMYREAVEIQSYTAAKDYSA